MWGVFWYVKGCRLLWRCCHGDGSYKDIEALKAERKRRPMTSVASSAAFTRLMVAAHTAVKNLEMNIPPHVKRRGKRWRQYKDGVTVA